MTEPIHLNPCCETTPELIPAVNTNTGKHFWIVYCFQCKREVISVSPELTARRWNIKATE